MLFLEWNSRVFPVAEPSIDIAIELTSYLSRLEKFGEAKNTLLNDYANQDILLKKELRMVYWFLKKEGIVPQLPEDCLYSEEFLALILKLIKTPESPGLDHIPLPEKYKKSGFVDEYEKPASDYKGYLLAKLSRNFGAGSALQLFKDTSFKTVLNLNFAWQQDELLSDPEVRAQLTPGAKRQEQANKYLRDLFAKGKGKQFVMEGLGLC